MARPGIEYEAVERVARQLLSQGQHPSVQKIRDILGTGSNTTIATHLKAWRANFAASKSPALPESVPEDLMNPLDDFWSLAVAKAETNYQKYKEELEEKVTAAELSQSEAMAQLEQKSGEIDELQQTLSAAQDKLRNTEQQWHTLQGEHSALTNELDHVHTEMERTHTLLQEQNQTFEAECEQLNKSNKEALQYERERATATENRLLNEVDQLRQTIKSLEADHLQQQKDLQTHQEKSRQRELALLEEQAGLKTKNQRLDAEHQQRGQETEDLKSQLATVQDQQTKLLEIVETLRKAFEQSKNKEIILTENIGQLKETIAKHQPAT